jgi:hypothetical protein
VTLIVTVGSLITYGNIVPMPQGTKPAFVFLVAPLASWVLLMVLVPLGALISRRT